MPDLLVDTKTLRDAGTSLRAVYQEFSSAGKNADVGRDVIAHDRLRSRLQEFADSWDDRRNDMAESIKGLGDLAEEAGKTYERLDTELAEALRGSS